MTQEDRVNLAKALIESSHRCITTARFNVEIDDYKAAANRSYYAIFDAIRAVLILQEEPQRSKHSGVIAQFRQEYIKTGLFDKRYSQTISDAFEIRNEADYDVAYLISMEEVQVQIERADEFLRAVETYLRNANVL